MANVDSRVLRRLKSRSGRIVFIGMTYQAGLENARAAMNREIDAAVAEIKADMKLLKEDEQQAFEQSRSRQQRLEQLLWRP